MARVHGKDKEFLFWDGEGITYKDGAPQEYVLFGHHLSEPLKGKRLQTGRILEWMLEEAEKYPNHLHVAFAFDYDANMILNSLRASDFRQLHKSGAVRYLDYRIEHVPHKWLRVSNMRTGQSIQIQDMFSFFQMSFIKALDSYHIPGAEKIAAGKANRRNFTWEDMEEIEEYWRMEGELGAELAHSLRDLLYSEGFFITKWHGPGSLANYLYTTKSISEHKAPEPPEVYEACRRGYAGGRFELFQLGRHEKVYGYDINSAYPWAISQLPSLTEGQWVYRKNPTEIREFGIYHFNLASWESSLPGPTFFRDSHGNVTFPWCGDVWLWSPEAANILGMPLSECSEAWEFVGWETRPFTFVPEMYETRRALKAAKDGGEKAYKLALNSLYGKQAQRTGWERTGEAPKWHQLSWAGWVTSKTRATLFELMRQMNPDKLVAVETDGLYCTATPDELGIIDSKLLGGWEVSQYDEMLYLQSGIYGYRQGDEWHAKYRGLDAGSLSAQDMAEVLKRCQPGERAFPTISGPTTRFTGYGAALMLRQDDTLTNKLKGHRVWNTTTKEISMGSRGKRFHVPDNCTACRQGATAYEMPHQLTINPIAQKEVTSQPHDIPWLEKDKAEWRVNNEIQKSLLADW